MRRMFIILLTGLFCSGGYAQWSADASLGLSFASLPAVRDYINTNAAPSNEQVNSFTSAVNFNGELNYRLNPNLDVSLSFIYHINSFTYSRVFDGSSYQFSYTVSKPDLCVYYVFPGQGYQFRAGAGAGPRFLSLLEKNFGFTKETQYSSTGFGISGLVDGSTALSSSAYAYIGAGLEVQFIPAPQSNGKKLWNPNAAQDVNFNSFSAFVRLGVMYQL